MAKTRKMVELFRAIAAEDMDGAAAIAAQICKREEQIGHRGAARLLRGALLANGHSATNGHSKPGTIFTNGTGMLPTALMRLQGTRLADVVLATSIRHELEDVITEWKHREQLYKRGISPRAKLLFHGPPGCGKSLTARALGHELNIPVYMVRFDAVIGAFLGQTAIHLRQLFHFAETTPCVLLLDELDALGKQRGNPLDVGELDRIVISLMQELEHSRPVGIIVGTSNLPKHLDNALWRRFDLDISFKAPGKTVLRNFLRKLASEKKVALPARVTQQATHADSFASAESIVTAEIRRQAIVKG
jgi:AAA+ superfamily predicted ATPase